MHAGRSLHRWLPWPLSLIVAGGIACGAEEEVEPSWSLQTGRGAVWELSFDQEDAIIVGAGSSVSRVERDRGEQWTWPPSTTPEIGLLDVTTDRDGQVFIVGEVFGEVDLDGGAVSSAGSADVLLVVLSRDGEPRMARAFGGSRRESGRAVAVDGEGNAWIVGSFEGEVDFGTGPLSLDAAIGTFLLGISPSGEVLDADAIAGDTVPEDIAVDASGNVYAAGWLDVAFDSDRTAVDFGDGWHLDAGDDAFLVRRDAGGGTAWAVAIPSGESTIDASVELTPDGDVIGASMHRVTRFSPDGAERWTFEIAGCGRNLETCGNLSDIASDQMGGAFAVGFHVTDANSDEGGEAQMAVWKVDEDGECRWQWTGGGDQSARAVDTGAQGVAVTSGDDGQLRAFNP